MTTHHAARAPERPRFWTEDDCKDLLRRLEGLTRGDGITTVAVWSTWHGNVRWARNLVSAAGETRNNVVRVSRDLHGARSGFFLLNDVADASLEAAVRHAERCALLQREKPSADPALAERYPLPLEPLTGRELFSDATYQLGAEARTKAAQRLAQLAAEQGVLSAGYVQVSAHSVAMLDSIGHMRYVPFTQAQYSVTARDPKQQGSGWAGDSHWDWAKLDAERLTQVALDKCLASRNPVRVEPGRYTTILEPQAVADFIAPFVTLHADAGDWTAADSLLGRSVNEVGWGGAPGPFNKSMPTSAKPGFARLGERLVDVRLSLSTDPTDPELGYPPFRFSSLAELPNLKAFHPVEWIKDGVLVRLSYNRAYAVQYFRKGTGLPNPGGFRMGVTGPTNTVEEMIAATKRGLLVTRFDQAQLLDIRSGLMRGYTRDGLWLVEDGKISKPVKNFQFTEGILAKLNSVEQVGAPAHAFHPMPLDLSGFPQPVIVPALKVSDFSFTALADAV